MLKKISRAAFITLLSILLTILISLSITCVGTASAYTEGETVILGGTPIGINAKSNELIVSEIVNVTTRDGSYSPALQSGIVKGDIIALIDNKKVNDIAEFNSAVQNSGETLMLTIKRGDVMTDVAIKPAYDIAQSQRKIGLMLKNEITGIGTLTFISKDGRYGALGHMIIDSFGYGSVYSRGTVYNCDIIGYNRANNEGPGELRGKIDYNSSVGTIDKNIFCGIYGNMQNYGGARQEIEVGLRNTVKNGKAQIYTTIEGETPKLYDIEIIKAIRQDSPADKSMVLRVTDKDLKNSTGGILQGMSGSPIIQNGKIIGAVTHVFTSDSTKGYGIYIDWMLPNA